MSDPVGNCGLGHDTERISCEDTARQIIAFHDGERLRDAAKYVLELLDGERRRKAKFEAWGPEAS